MYLGIFSRPLLALILVASMTTNHEAFAQDRPMEQLIDLPSAHAFEPTLERIASSLEGAGMRIFARIDHRQAAQKAGMDMPPTTVLIYGNPKGGTPLMNATPNLALDLPLRVLVREDMQGKVHVVFHDALTLTRPYGLADDKALALRRGQGLIADAIGK